MGKKRKPEEMIRIVYEQDVQNANVRFFADGLHQVDGPLQRSENPRSHTCTCFIWKMKRQPRSVRFSKVSARLRLQVEHRRWVSRVDQIQRRKAAWRTVRTVPCFRSQRGEGARTQRGDKEADAETGCSGACSRPPGVKILTELLALSCCFPHF